MPAGISHIALLLAGAPLLGPPSPDSARGARDTLRTYRLGAVEISADRYPVSPSSGGAVSYDVPMRGAGSSRGLAEEIQGVRNLHVIPYGGGLALRTVSLRGMGSEHTMVLWHGMFAGNVQSGVSDLNLFDGGGLRAVRVVPGEGSALYGASAVGGVVNLVADIPWRPVPRVRAGLKTGSFGEWGRSADAEFAAGPAAGVSIHAGTHRGRADFPFSPSPGGADSARSNSDYHARSGRVAFGWEGGSGRLGVVGTTLALDQGSPAPWPGPQGSARRSDHRSMALITYESAAGDGAGFAGTPGSAAPGPFLSASASVDRQHERYIDPDRGYDNYYQTLWAGASIRFRGALSDAWLLHAGGDASLARSAGNALDRIRTRESGALAASMAWTPVRTGTARLTVTGSGRVEKPSDFSTAFSPKIGIAGEARTDGLILLLHASAGAGRRYPTMNELYYRGEGGAGNAGLAGESSVSFDAGIGGSGGADGRLSWDITWYSIRMTNRIQWIPTVNPRIWTPANLGRTRSSGWEMSAAWKPAPSVLEIRGDYSIVDSKRGDVSADGTIGYTRQLMHIPLDKGSAELLIGLPQSLLPAAWLDLLAARLRFIHTGERYTVEDNTVSLPAYRILDCSLDAETGFPGWSLVASWTGRNLTLEDYEVMPGYPMPRFHQTLSINCLINL